MYCCVYSARLLMMDTGTVRNMWSSVVCFLLGNSPASEFYMPRRKHTTYRTRRKFEIKNVEFYSKNKFEKLVHLVGFIIGIDFYHCCKIYGIPYNIQYNVHYM